MSYAKILRFSYTGGLYACLLAIVRLFAYRYFLVLEIMDYGGLADGFAGRRCFELRFDAALRFATLRPSIPKAKV